MSSTDDRLRPIEAMTDAALAHLNVEDLLVELLERVQGLLEVDTAAVLLLDPATERLVATAARGIEAEVRQGIRIPLGKGFAGRIAAEKRPVILEQLDHTNVLNPILRERGIRSMLGVPLVRGGSVIASCTSAHSSRGGSPTTMSECSRSRLTGSPLLSNPGVPR